MSKKRIKIHVPAPAVKQPNHLLEMDTQLFALSAQPPALDLGDATQGDAATMNLPAQKTGQTQDHPAAFGPEFSKIEASEAQPLPGAEEEAPISKQDEKQGQLDSKSHQDSVMKHELDEANQGSVAEAKVQEGEPVQLESKEDPAAMVEGKGELQEQEPPTDPASVAAETGKEAASVGEETEAEAEQGSEELAARTEEVHEASAGAVPPAPPASGGGNGQPSLSAAPADPAALNQELQGKKVDPGELADIQAKKQTPAQMKAEAASLLEGLRQKAAQQKALINDTAATSVAQVEAAATAKLAEVDAALQTNKAQAEAAHAQARDAINANFQAQKAALDTEKATQLSAIDADGLKNIAQFQEQLQARRESFDAYVAEQRRQPRVISEREAARAAQELNAAAAEAIAVGETEAAKRSTDEEKNAARKVASESAADIRSKIGDIRADLMGRSGEVDGKFQEYLDMIHDNLTQTEQSALPGYQQAIDTAKQSVESSYTAAAESLEQKRTQDLAAVDASATATNQQLDQAADQARNGIRNSKQSLVEGINTAASSICDAIQARLTEAEGAVGNLNTPYVAGVRDVIAAKGSAIDETASGGVSSLNGMANGADSSLKTPVDGFNTAASQAVSAAQSAMSTLQASDLSAMTATVNGFKESAAQIKQAMNAQHQQMTTELMGEVDKAIEEARGKVAQIVRQYDTDLKKAADDAIVEAKKPLTDPLFIRVFEAADRANEPWWKGALRALASIVEGLIILVIVAVIVAAIAALFGVFLTAWTAIMIAGAILLLVGLAASIYMRSQQPELGGNPFKIVGVALMDTVGLTGIIEGFSGHDFVTERELSDGEQTERGIMGWFTAITLVIGARSAIKGPPGGSYTRPVELPSGAFSRMWAGGKGVLVDVYTGIRDFFKRGEEKPTENQSNENKGNENQSNENQSNENKGNENQSNENQSNENKGNENQSNENQSNENKGNENQSNENQSTENKGNENQSNENQSNENKGNENQSNENQSNENQTNENKTPERPRNPKFPDYKPCFLAGTLVLTPAGAIAIEDIVEGTQVLSNGGSGLAPEAYMVTATLVNKTQNLVEVVLASGSIRATRDHQFLVDGEGWFPAKNLEPGQLLTTPAGTAAILEVRAIALTEEVATFNITVDISHTYYVAVGGEWVLVHNDDPFEGVLYWLFKNTPTLRPDDHDGLSLWRTNNRKEVNEFFETRVHDSGQKTDAAHSYYTEQQLKEMQLVKTPSDNVLAQRGLDHYSLRQKGISSEAGYHLNEQEMAELTEQLKGLEKSTSVKPKSLKC